MDKSPAGAEAELTLCTTCQPEGAETALAELRRALDEAGLEERVALRGQACLNCCAEPVALALQGAGRATFVFAGVDPVADRADLLATLRLYLQSPGGWIEDARPCGRLRHRLKARIRARGA